MAVHSYGETVHIHKKNEVPLCVRIHNSLQDTLPSENKRGEAEGICYHLPENYMPISVCIKHLWKGVTVSLEMI